LVVLPVNICGEIRSPTQESHMNGKAEFTAMLNANQEGQVSRHPGI